MRRSIERMIVQSKRLELITTQSPPYQEGFGGIGSITTNSQKPTVGVAFALAEASRNGNRLVITD